MDGIFGDRLPARERIEQHDGESRSSQAADNGDEQGLGENLTKQSPSRRPDGDADGQFAGAVGRASGKDSCEIDAGGNEHQQGKQHDGGKKRTGGTAKKIAEKTGLAEACAEAVVHNWIFTRKLTRYGDQIVGGLAWSHAGFEHTEGVDAVIRALGEIAVSLDLFLVDHRDTRNRARGIVRCR